MLLAVLCHKMPGNVLRAAKKEEDTNSQSPKTNLVLMDFPFQPFFMNNANDRVAENSTLSSPFPFPFFSLGYSDTVMVITLNEQGQNRETAEEKKTVARQQTGQQTRSLPPRYVHLRKKRTINPTTSDARVWAR